MSCGYGYVGAVRWLVLVLLTARAYAEPHDLVARPLVLEPGQVSAEAVLEVDLYPGLVGRPISLAPDAWVGITDRLTVGIVHSDPALDRFAITASICLQGATEDPYVCERTYAGGALDVLWSLQDGALAIAGRARVIVRGPDVDPVWKPALAAGLLVRWTRGRWAIVGDPYVQGPLANGSHGNGAALFFPITATVQPAARWAIDLRTGLDGVLADFGEKFRVPVWIGGRRMVTNHLEVGAALGFYQLLGPQETTNDRALFATIGWRT